MSVDLINLKDKCRLCFQRAGTARKSVDIDEEIQEKFRIYTNLELIMSNNYSSSVCKQCLATLNEHIKYKDNMIANQMKLYSHVDSHNFVNVNIKEEPLELHGTFIDFNHPEEFSVKMENDEDNRHEDLENEFKLKVETQPTQENPKTTKLKKKKFSEDQIQSTTKAVTSGQLTFQGLKKSKNFKYLKMKEACKYCSLLVIRRHIRRHERVHENKLANIFLYCDKCNYKTHAKENLRRHMRNHFKCQDVSEFVCYFCSKSFTSVLNKNVHERSHVEPQRELVCDFPCIECDQVFNRKWKLDTHKESHRPAKEVPCEVCGKLVKTQSYNSHLKYHGPRTHQCSFEGCTKNFFTKTQVAYHIENHHEESKNIKCPECASVFSNKGKLKLHIVRSHTAPSFFCEVEGCSYKQTRKHRLKLHVRNHRDIEPRLKDELLKKLGGRLKD